MKKVTQILFDDEIGLPIFVLEDGTKRVPYEIKMTDFCDCVALEWREDTVN